jgi:hypothetical protein
MTEPSALWKYSAVRRGSAAREVDPPPNQSSQRAGWADSMGYEALILARAFRFLRESVVGTGANLA